MEIKIELPYALSAEDNEQPVPECDGEAWFWFVLLVGRYTMQVLYEHREQVLIRRSKHVRVAVEVLEERHHAYIYTEDD